MKKWNVPSITELNINETEYCLYGYKADGGTFDDSHLGVLDHGDCFIDLNGNGVCDYCDGKGGDTNKRS